MEYIVNALYGNRLCRRSFVANQEFTAILEMLKFCISKQGLKAMSFQYSTNNELTFLE